DPGRRPRQCDRRAHHQPHDGLHLHAAQPEGAARMSPIDVPSGAPRPTPRARFARRFARQPLAMIALGYLLVVVVVALVAPWIVPHDPNAQSLTNVLADPSAEHVLGTDELGRDVLSRLLMGSRVSLLAAVQGTVVALAIGVPVGLVAGF